MHAPQLSRMVSTGEIVRIAKTRGLCSIFRVEDVIHLAELPEAERTD